ncbi:MAG: outer membrane protein assembly factor BamD [Candidatus Omnitrophota bacterium]
MRKIFLVSFIVGMVAYILAVPSGAYWIWTPESGKWVNPKYAVKDTPEEQFNYATAFYIAKDYKRSLAEFEKLVRHYPLSRFAPEAQFYVGLSHENLNNFYQAFNAYKLLLEKYPKFEKIKEAVEREFTIGEMFLAGKKRKLMGIELLPAVDKAIEVFQDVVKNSPYGEYGDRALFRLGECYKKIGSYQEAKESFQQIIDDYPNSSLIADARFQIAACSERASLKPSYTQEITKDAIEEFREFVKEHPDTAAAQEAQASIQKLQEKEIENLFSTALFYEKQGKFTSAEIYYRDIIEKYPNSQWSAKSLERLNIIEKRKSKRKR